MAVESPTVTIPQGTYIGKPLNDPNHPVPISAWLGIPYAQPPLGDLRFARPQPLPPSDKTFEAKEYGYRCPGKQLLKLPNLPEASEDCLTLNIFKKSSPSPRDATSPPADKKLLPIMLYLHGGAFNRGTASMHDTASMLSHSAAPFLAISINYRLGALGFLNCALTAKHGLLNIGLHDQRLAMEWVRSNAAAFGGDAENITLVGLSAGAHSIAHHMMNLNEPRELFQRAVIESGAHTSRAVHPYNSALHETQFQEFLSACACPQHILKDSEQILPWLRSLPESTIVEAQAEVFDAHNPSVRWAWQPVIDGEIISRRPLEAWHSGRWHDIPVLTGLNHNEGTMYVPKHLDTNEEFRGFFKTLLPQLGKGDLDRLEELYPDPVSHAESPYRETRKGLGKQYKRLEAAYGQYAYVAPARQTAHHLSTSSARAPSPSSKQPVYLYHWALPSSIATGANHGDQMWYETLSPSVTSISAEQNKVARYFHDYICSFVCTGDPNAVRGTSGERPTWKAFAGEGEGKEGETMIFGEGNEERIGGSALGSAAAMKRDRWAEKEVEWWWEKNEVSED